MLGWSTYNIYLYVYEMDSDVRASAQALESSLFRLFNKNYTLTLPRSISDVCNIVSTLLRMKQQYSLAVLVSSSVHSQDILCIGECSVVYDEQRG